MDAKKGQYQEENGAAEAKYDLDDAYLHVLGSQAEKRAGFVACLPSRLERGVGERCERKQSEADLHRHCDTPHFVNEEHIVAGENAKNAQTRRNFEVHQQSPHVDLAIDGEFAMKQMK